MIEFDVDGYVHSYAWLCSTFLWALATQRKNLLEHSYLVTNKLTGRYEVCIEPNDAHEFIFLKLNTLSDTAFPYRVIRDDILHINVVMWDQEYEDYIFHKSLWTVYRFNQRARNNYLQTMLVDFLLTPDSSWVNRCGSWEDVINLYPKKEKSIDENVITLIDIDEENLEWESTEYDYDNPKEVFMWSLQPDFGKRDWEILEKRWHVIFNPGTKYGTWLGITECGTWYGWIPRLVQDLLELPERPYIGYTEYDTLIRFIEFIDRNN